MVCHGPTLFTLAKGAFLTLMGKEKKRKENLLSVGLSLASESVFLIILLNLSQLLHSKATGSP